VIRQPPPQFRAATSGQGEDEHPRFSETLVIASGNTLRRDDGVGTKVAEAIQTLKVPGVRVILCHQLVPELAEPISQASRVVFVDAEVGGAGEVGLYPLAAGTGRQILAHALAADSLLGMAGRLYGRTPPGWSLTIPAHEMGFGEHLSAPARRGVEQAIEMLTAFLADASNRREGLCSSRIRSDRKAIQPPPCHA
jgi:hydrogenase maturation protease